MIENRSVIAGCCGKKMTVKGHKGTFLGSGTIYIMVTVVVTWSYIFIQIHGQLGDFILWNLYLIYKCIAQLRTLCLTLPGNINSCLPMLHAHEYDCLHCSGHYHMTHTHASMPSLPCSVVGPDLTFPKWFRNCHNQLLCRMWWEYPALSAMSLFRKR